MSKLDTESARAGYDDVRDDNSQTTWTLLKYEENTIRAVASHQNYEDLLSQLGDDERAYAFVRIETGDELSKRAKFALITWIGESVSPLKKAKVSIDKALVKDVFQNFAVEVLTGDKGDLKFESVKKLVVKAGGANYGTGK
eukprot:Nk52_evm12s269 gene=Nk52_evmTU12s269